MQLNNPGSGGVASAAVMNALIKLLYRKGTLTEDDLQILRSEAPAFVKGSGVTSEEARKIVPQILKI